MIDFDEIRTMYPPARRTGLGPVRDGRREAMAERFIGALSPRADDVPSCAATSRY